MPICSRLPCPRQSSAVCPQPRRLVRASRRRPVDGGARGPRQERRWPGQRPAVRVVALLETLIVRHLRVDLTGAPLNNPDPAGVAARLADVRQRASALILVFWSVIRRASSAALGEPGGDASELHGSFRFFQSRGGRGRCPPDARAVGWGTGARSRRPVRISQVMAPVISAGEAGRSPVAAMAAGLTVRGGGAGPRAGGGRGRRP